MKEFVIAESINLTEKEKQFLFKIGFTEIKKVSDEEYLDLFFKLRHENLYPSKACNDSR